MGLKPLVPRSITSFSGTYSWLSNFYPVKVEFDGLLYPSVENAYQASKTAPHLRSQFLDVTAGFAKRLGQTVPLRPGFEREKILIMTVLTDEKYRKDRFRTLLLATGDMKIVEGNTWGDTFWGVCNGVGENHLGKIIMKIREELRAA